MSVWINELHYDNAGSDIAERIELAGAAGTSLAGWSIVLYNGNDGKVYGSALALGGLEPTVVDGQAFWNVPAPGLQNGSPDGLALVNTEGAVVQFLSYEGAFTAVDGPAAGMLSTDIGVAQSGSEEAGLSLQLTGVGQAYADFTWVAGVAATPGQVNVGQTFGVPDGSGPTEPPLGEPVPIHAIQGNGGQSPLVGQTVTVSAIVVGDFQNGDADAARNLTTSICGVCVR